MKLLITGGAGFIGSHIQDKLIEHGHEVAILDNLRSGKKENIREQSKFYEVDITDKIALEEALLDFRPKAIFHLAAQNEVPYSMDHPYEDATTNIIGMMNLCEAAVKAHVPKIIYSNTGGAYYGDVDEIDLPVKEDHIIKKPTSFYGVSKGTAEMYLKLYAHIYELQFVSLRYSNVYGPRQDGNKEAGVIAIFTSKMLNGNTPVINGNGEITRDYIYVGDVANANLKALEFAKNDYFNIATGTRTSVREVYDLIAQELEITTPPELGPERPGDVKHNALDIGKAEAILEWKPDYTLAEGIRETIKYYKR
jgi:UDP-glucose 4-epimerase